MRTTLLILLKQNISVKQNMTTVYPANDGEDSTNQLINTNNVTTELVFQSVDQEIDGDEVAYQHAYEQVLDTDHAQVHCGDHVNTSVQQQEWSASGDQVCLRNQNVDTDEQSSYQSVNHTEHEEPPYLLADYQINRIVVQQEITTVSSSCLQVIHDDAIDKPAEQAAATDNSATYHEIMLDDHNNTPEVNVGLRDNQDSVTLKLVNVAQSHSNLGFISRSLST